MKKLIPLSLSVVGLGALCGCMGLASTVGQLKDDPATVHLQVSTIYGQITLDRQYPTNFVRPITVISNIQPPSVIFAPVAPPAPK